ncbi:MAG TPA: transcriptional regulator [Ruminiclostridium sp.]
MDFLEVFSSSTRIRMIEMLDNKPMNIKDMAIQLGISSAIVTKHIQKMETAKIIKCKNIAGKRGIQKICSLNLDEVTLKFKSSIKSETTYECSIPVGQYISYNVHPTCGLASKTKYIGMFDDPRYFADPNHNSASLIWFGYGWVEYRIPNYLSSNQLAKSIEISLEICSEFPGYKEEWPSDIIFYINNINIGMWTAPGNFGENKGILTPEWWNCGSQYGLLKNITVNEAGSFIDGIKISSLTIAELNLTFNSEITFRLANNKNSRNVGGITIFGKYFGNYNQDIKAIIEYVDMKRGLKL